MGLYERAELFANPVLFCTAQAVAPKHEMPYWTEIADELSVALNDEGVTGFDTVRRKYLRALSDYTNRDTILYATCWTQLVEHSSSILINFEDIQGLMAVMPALYSDDLDLIIHSPGGSAEATKAMVDYLRLRFKRVRVIVPNLAMSAAAMFACSGDTIVMGKHSSLGPIDPQLTLPTALGERTIPAQRIVQQFKWLVDLVGQQPSLSFLLNQYGPELLVTCDHLSQLSRNLVADWLGKYMFRDQVDGQKKAGEIADWLGNHENFKSHGMTISRDELRSKGLEIENLEEDDRLQDLVLSVFHATTLMFQALGVQKIIENQNGLAFMRFITPPANTPTGLESAAPMLEQPQASVSNLL
jgi:hypothetical protein